MGTSHRIETVPPVQADPKLSRKDTKKSQSKVQAQASPETISPLSGKSSGSKVSGKISGKGQITLPISVRNRLGIKAGDQVEFFFDGERTLIRPVRGDGNTFERWIGIAKNVPEDFNVNDWVSEMRDDSDRRLDLKEARVANGG